MASPFSCSKTLKGILGLFLFLLGNQSYGQVSYQPLYDNGTFARQIDLSLPVGIIEGHHGVSATGAATYNIPIKLPPGTNGMIPDISVNYNSQGGNNIVGYDWGLSAISSISKVNRTFQDDDVNDVPNADYPYNFALDGNKLRQSHTSWDRI